MFACDPNFLKPGREGKGLFLALRRASKANRQIRATSISHIIRTQWIIMSKPCCPRFAGIARYFVPLIL